MHNLPLADTNKLLKSANIKWTWILRCKFDLNKETFASKGPLRTFYGKETFKRKIYMRN